MEGSCKIDGVWWILLEGSETKSGRPDERPIAPSLGGVIDRWLNEWRKTFRKSEDFVWASTKGGCLAYTYVGDIISKRTRQELGVAISPHLFRDCAVYTIANLAGENMGIASGLLQHLDPRVTGDNYNKGELFTAARRYQRLLLNQGPQPTRTGNE